MTALLFLLGVVLFIIGLALSVGLHELGHLIPGKLFGVKVTQYFIGFGPTVWSRRRGETEYGLKALPFGGYVKLIGMLPPGRTGSSARPAPRPGRAGLFSQIVDDARHAEADLVQVGDEDRLFYKLPWWKKVLVMGSGVMTNLVIAFLLFAVVFMGHGIRTPTTTVKQVADCVVVVSKDDAGKTLRKCQASDPRQPGQAGRAPQGRPADRVQRQGHRRLAPAGERDPPQRRQEGRHRRQSRRPAAHPAHQHHGRATRRPAGPEARRQGGVLGGRPDVGARAAGSRVRGVDDGQRHRRDPPRNRHAPGQALARRQGRARAGAARRRTAR